MYFDRLRTYRRRAPLPAAEETNGGEKITTKSQLVGYVRKSKSGGCLKLSIDAEAFAAAERFSAKDGRQFVSLIANADKVSQILDGEREITSLCQLIEEQ